jgi:hypothetical protein
VCAGDRDGKEKETDEEDMHLLANPSAMATWEVGVSVVIEASTSGKRCHQPSTIYIQPTP